MGCRMNRSASAIFSLKTLAWCWAGLLTSLAAGAVALQLTAPAPVSVQVAIQPAAPLPPTIVPPEPVPVVSPVPFQNHSLLAMLPPPIERPLHQAPRVSVSLPVPPVPPLPRVAHLEPRRVVRVYAAEPAYAQPEWSRIAPYATEYARLRPYAYAAPPAYYGW